MKIGSYSIPLYRLDTLLDATKEIYEQFGGDEVSTELIGPVLGHAPKGGAFLQKMADLRSYGLISGTRDKIKVTELGKQVTLFTDDVEKNEALQEIIGNIPLWRIFLDKYGYDIDEKNFWVDLVRITGAERLDAQKEAKSVRRAYLKDVRYITPVDEPTKTPQDEEAVSREAADRTWSMEALPIGSKTVQVNIKYPERNESRLEINDWGDYEIFKQYLESILSKLNIKKQAEPRKEDPQEDANKDEEVEMLDSEHIEDVDLQEQ
jgi:hypothetical protein